MLIIQQPFFCGRHWCTRIGARGIVFLFAASHVSLIDREFTSGHQGQVTAGRRIIGDEWTAVGLKPEKWGGPVIIILYD